MYHGGIDIYSLVMGSLLLIFKHFTDNFFVSTTKVRKPCEQAEIYIIYDNTILAIKTRKFYNIVIPSDVVMILKNKHKPGTSDRSTLVIKSKLLP